VVGQIDVVIMQLLQLSVLLVAETVRLLVHLALDNRLALLRHLALVPFVVQLIVSRRVLKAQIDPIISPAGAAIGLPCTPHCPVPTT
jgi:hypothetical protein